MTTQVPKVSRLRWIHSLCLPASILLLLEAGLPFPSRSCFSLTSTPHGAGVQAGRTHPGSQGRHTTWAWAIGTSTPTGPETVREGHMTQVVINTAKTGP